MTPENRLFKEFIYFYSEVLKFLQGVAKNNISIGFPMVFFIVNIINKQLEAGRTLQKKELMNPRLIPNSTFYRLFTLAQEAGFISEGDGNTYSFPYELPPHLKVPDLVHKKMIHI